MAEWFKATVLKTVELQGSVGSNPTPSATGYGGRWRPMAPELWVRSIRGRESEETRSHRSPWRGARVAESGRLLSG